ncbi:MAG: hypothetical protein AAF488_01180 [Planctomycetota bacterium]
MVATLIASIVLSVAASFVRAAVEAERRARLKADARFAIDRALATLRRDHTRASSVVAVDGRWTVATWRFIEGGWEFGPLVRVNALEAQLVTHRFEPVSDRSGALRGPRSNPGGRVVSRVDRLGPRFHWVRRVEARSVDPSSGALSRAPTRTTRHRLLEGVRWSVVEAKRDAAPVLIAPGDGPLPSSADSTLHSPRVWFSRRLLRVRPSWAEISQSSSAEGWDTESAPDSTPDALTRVRSHRGRWLCWAALSEIEDAYLLRPYRSRNSVPFGSRAGAMPLEPLVHDGGLALLSWRGGAQESPVVLVDRPRLLVVTIERDEVAARALIEFASLR